MLLGNLIGRLSGKITVYTKNIEDVEVTLANKKIDINTTNKELVKDILASFREGRKEGVSQLSDFRRMFDMAKNTADELCDQGVTVTFSYQGDVMVTIGADAKPKISQFITGKSIEINNLPKLIQLVV
jgi:hypothetical protein